MTRIELSLNSKYLPKWDAWSGIREFVSNGKDAEVEFNAPLSITWLNGTLRIENDGAEMDRNVLLFGTTSKTGRTDMVGRFGEGIKLGTLALVRAGHTVKIRTGDEVWIAAIERSEKYDADVLVFDCRGGNEPKKRVRVEISGVAEEVWETMRERFLFVARTKKNDRVETERGDLLLGEARRGQIFVKGIFVQHNTKLAYGYDFKHADVDRDRAMVKSYDIDYEAAQIWGAAVVTRPDLMDPFYELIVAGKPDVAGYEYNADHASETVQAAIAKRFTKQFGKDAMPVQNLSESNEVEHLGKRGIVVSQSLNTLLTAVLGSKEEQLQALNEEVTKKWSRHQLSETQWVNLITAIATIKEVREGCTLDRIDVVSFRSPTMNGQHKDKRLLLAEKLLNDRAETLRVLVHEFTHDVGGDGEKGHVHAIELLWRDIVKSLWKV